MTFEKVSKKQAQVLRWWNEKPVCDKYDSIICDGAVRSGKTTVMIMSFVLWAMDTFGDRTFGICGKTVRSAERNIIMPLQQTADITSEYELTYTRSINLLTVSGGGRRNYFYVFGGKDESSYQLIQGITLSGVFFDEVALMPESFVNQAIARTLSVSNRRLWFNCNPENPSHWFYRNWIEEEERKKKNAAHLHFTMKDNPILTEDDISKAEKLYSGVFYERYILGKWVIADGLIYQQFAENIESFMLKDNEVPKSFTKILIGIDWGDSGSGHSFTAVGIAPGFKDMTVLRSEKHSAKNLTPKDIESKVVTFTANVIRRYGAVQSIFCDHINTFINGCRVALREAGITAGIGQAYKCEINERILITNKLMALGGLKLVKKDCQSLIEAFKNAVWDSKHPDKRLDDGTSDIDSLDSFEYSWSTYIDMFSFNKY